MKLFNTMSGRKEDFRPLSDQVRMYVCGITPYDEPHLGHAMKDVVFDVLRRYLEYRGFKVLHVQNHTDVDDKIIERAAQLGLAAADLAETQIESYMSGLRSLNILPATHYPRVTSEMDSIIEMISGLIKSEFAYVVDGSVYYRVDRKPDYGKLSNRSVDSMLAGARLEPDQTKENPADFALWKDAKEGEPSWSSPWGEGRPGWHIECSAMALNYLGDPLDIHGGGIDLLFPHHENEIAQSEAYTDREPFARFWVHNGLMQLNGEKMSKSTGNYLSLADALDSYGPDALRIFILSSHYRSPLNCTEAGLRAAVQNAERIRAAATAASPARVERELDPARHTERFVEVMDDDLNTAQAITVLYELVREINKGREEGASVEQAQACLRELAGVLGLCLKERDMAESEDIGPLVSLLIDVRKELRTAKQFAIADSIRDRLTDMGIVLEDAADGTRWKRISGPGS